MIMKFKLRGIQIRYFRLYKYLSVVWAWKRYTQVELSFRKDGIYLCNNIGGQLGPDRLSHGLVWRGFLNYGLRAW